MTTTFSNFCKNNNFVGFNRPQMSIDPISNKKTSPFNNVEGWKNYTTTNIKALPQWKTNVVMTGKISGITVIDFDDLEQLDLFRIKYPDFCEKTFQVKSQGGGLHYYCKYREDIANVSNDEGIDFRNDGGIIYSHGTEVLGLNNEKNYYEYLGGELGYFSDEIFDYFKSICKNVSTTKNDKTQKKPIFKLKEPSLSPISVVEISESSYPKNTEQRWIDLLGVLDHSAVDKKGEKLIRYHDWLLITTVMKTNGFTEEQWRSWDKSVKDISSTWNNIKTTEIFSWFSLQKIAKKLYLGAYKEWLIKHNQYLHLGILGKGEADIAEHIKNELKQVLVFCQDKWYKYDEETHLWVKIKEPCSTITRFIQRQINISLECVLYRLENVNNAETEKELNKEIDEYRKYHKLVCKPAFYSMICKILKDDLMDDKFIEKLDISLYRVVYKNGILDLKTGVFNYHIDKSDYITKTIPFDYEPAKEEDITAVKIILKKICNWNNSHLDYYLSSLGYAFTSDSEKEQSFWYLRGQTASNGKSIIFEVLEKLMPNYVLKGNSAILDKGSDLRKEVNTWRGLKLLWLNELSTKLKDEDIVKAICDGTGLKYDKLYSEDAIVMKILFKLFCVSNNSINIKGDEGVKRRFCQEQLNSQFKEEYTDDYEKLLFKVDKNLNADLCGKYKHALLHIIFEYSTHYWNEKKLKPYPQEWKDGATETMENNNHFKDWFEDTFELCIGGTISRRMVETLQSNSICKYENFRDGLARLRVSYTFNSQFQVPRGNGGGKGLYTGFKLRENNAETENDDY